MPKIDAVSHTKCFLPLTNKKHVPWPKEANKERKLFHSIMQISTQSTDQHMPKHKFYQTKTMGAHFPLKLTRITQNKQHSALVIYNFKRKMWALGRFNKKNGPTKYGKTRHGVQLTANSWHKGFFEYVQSKTAFKVFNSFHSHNISLPST